MFYVIAKHKTTITIFLFFIKEKIKKLLQLLINHAKIKVGILGTIHLNQKYAVAKYWMITIIDKSKFIYVFK